jgi:Raf kinase inhibitor-like YbhB/YbcL family protein
MRTRAIAVLFCMASTLQQAGCGSEEARADDSQIEAGVGTLQLTSSAFNDNGAIPKRYTCEGENIAPPLSWQGAPEGTRSFAFILDDPDAPDPAAPKTVWVHWVWYDVPAGNVAIPEGGELPPGGKSGTNDFKKTGYGGPCPPVGRHRYFHTLYALDKVLGDLRAPTKAQLLEAMKGHVLARVQLMGTYQKAK